MLERNYEIAKINFKHHLIGPFAVAVVFVAIAPLLMGMKNLDEMQVAKIMEFYLGFLGVILLVPLFLPDTDKNIRDLLASKKTALTTVRLIRLLEAALCLLALLLVFLYVLKTGDCTFRYGACLFAAAANAVMMGGTGLLCYSLVDNVALAYMIPFLYYAMSMGGGEKYLGHFWLFGYSGGGSIQEKGWLFAGGILLGVLSLVIRGKGGLCK